MSVNLRPGILGEIQAVLGALIDKDSPFDLVFCGGSGSSAEDVAANVSHGVIKMNIATDTQYVFTKSIAGHMFSHWKEVLKIDGNLGNIKACDPRS